MVPKVHLTSHSRMSGSRWVITPSWLSGSWRSFLYSSSVYSCHSFLISSAFVRYTISALYCAHLCMKCSLGICNFLQEIFSLPHSIAFLYFFALITEEGFLIFPCYYAAKSLQWCPTLCNPIHGSPPGSPVPGILQARTLEWAAISFSSPWKWKMKVKSPSHVWLLATPWTEAYQAPPSRQEYWSGVTNIFKLIFKNTVLKCICKWSLLIYKYKCI